MEGLKNEQEYSEIIEEMYNSSSEELTLNDIFLDLSVSDINDIFGKTLFIIMGKGVQIDMDKYNKLAIFVKNEVSLHK